MRSSILTTLAALSFTLTACGEAWDMGNSTTEAEQQDTDTSVDTDTGSEIETETVDSDGDGYGAEVDCDDTSSVVYPGAEEICDGIDNDCDSEIDEGCEDDGDTGGDTGGTDDTGEPEDTGDTGSGEDTGSADTGGTDTGSDDTGSEPTDTGEPTEVEQHDADGDGIMDVNADGDIVDCDDTDATVNPLADEVCGDDIDQDCDGEDEECPEDPDTGGDTGEGDTGSEGDTGDTGEPDTDLDSDGDGYASTTDCDDGDSESYPGAEEVCGDSIDQDCDGEDEECEDTGSGDTGSGEDTGDTGGTDTGSEPTDTGEVEDTGDTGSDTGEDTGSDTGGDTGEDCTTVTWYLDTDEDGYGDASSSMDACDQPSGYVADDTDCNDSDADVYPGADELEDGMDTDCSGSVDEDLYWSDTDADGNVDALCMTDSLFTEDYQGQDAYVVGYDLFDWSTDSSDLVELNSEGFHCLSFLGYSADSNVEFTLIVEDGEDTGWQVLTDICPSTSGQIAYEVCESQGGTDYLLVVDWDGSTLTPSGDGA